MSIGFSAFCRRGLAALALAGAVLSAPALQAQQLPVAPGMGYYINASDWGLGQYSAKPKFYTEYGNPVTGKFQRASLKTMWFAPGSTSLCFLWTKKVKLYNKTTFLDAQESGWTLKDWLDSGAQPDLRMTGWLASADLALPAAYPVDVVLMAPNITAVTPQGGYYSMTGFWFGTKKPKVWIEYRSTDGTVKRLKCKVLAPIAHVDINGKPSYMDWSTGDSQVDFLMPGGDHPNDLATYLGFACIDNGVGMHYGTYAP